MRCRIFDASVAVSDAFFWRRSYCALYISGVEELDFVGLIFWNLYKVLIVLQFFVYISVVITVIVSPSIYVLSQVEDGLPTALSLCCVAWVNFKIRMWRIMSLFYVAESCYYSTY